jgi:opacity protein-like surface antigen
MKPSRIVQILTLVAVVTVLFQAPARAEDTKGKWQFGFGISFYSTTDYIRSNADTILTDGSVVDENGLPSVRYVDERPDINVLNEPSIQDDFKLDFSASYGLTRWFAVELAASYLEAPLGNIEFYSEDSSRSIQGSGTPITNLNVCGPNLNNTCFNYTTSSPFTVRENTFLEVGQLTQIPVHLSGLVRFRPESPLDPYVGLGIGYIFADIETADRFDARAQAISEMTVASISRGEITDATPPPDPRGTGFTPGPLQAEVEDVFEWHAVGGVDYYVNERFSFYVDARYTWTSGEVEITTDGAPQVRIAVPDVGTLLLFQQGSAASEDQYYLWEDVGVAQNAGCRSNTGYDCQGNGLFETEDKNLNGLLDPGEDNGEIIVLPPGSSDVNEAFDDLAFNCPQCVGNGGIPLPSMPTISTNPDTEDVNFNAKLDRFLLFGRDVCTDAALVDQFPECQLRTPVESTNVTKYVYPAGCSESIPSAGGTAKGPEGCPPPLGISAGKTGVDDVADIFIVQGGSLRMGGFSLGLGFKLTF